jgi:hypothetical protein
MTTRMTPQLAAALDEARALAASRGWRVPGDATLAEAEHVLALVRAAGWRMPAVQAEPDGAIAFEWESGKRGWLSVSVRGDGRIEHGAVIDGDEYGKVEDFDGTRLPDWVGELLQRLLSVEH